MRQYIRQACLSRTFPVTKPQISGWTFLRMTQKSYLIDLMEYKNVYVGAFASSEYVFEDFRDLTASTHGALILFQPGCRGRFPLRCKGAGPQPLREDPG